MFCVSITGGAVHMLETPPGLALFPFSSSYLITRKISLLSSNELAQDTTGTSKPPPPCLLNYPLHTDRQRCSSPETPRSWLGTTVCLDLLMYSAASLVLSYKSHVSLLCLPVPFLHIKAVIQPHLFPVQPIFYPNLLQPSSTCVLANQQRVNFGLSRIS